MMRYIGKGAFIHGVPARDLTDAEVEKFGKQIAEQEEITGVQIYAPVKAAKKSAGKDDK